MREIGMNAEDAFSTMMLFVAPWLSAHAQSLSDSHVLVYRSFFERLRLEPSEDFGKILANVVQTVQSARGSVRALYSPADLRPFHALPLARAPLLDLGGVVACASTKLLSERLQRGWHHILLSAFPRASREAKRYLDFMGDVFEDYVDRLFRRIYPSSPVLANSYLGPREIESHLTQSKCDAIIDDGDTLLLFECKAKQFPFDAVCGESVAAYERAWLDTYIEGAARQLDSTVRAIKGGKLKSTGLEPQRFRRFIPIACTLDVTPLGPHQHHRLWSETRSRGLLTESDVAPMQAITVAELETLELHVHLGAGSIGDLFRRKVDDVELRENPVRTTTFRFGSPEHSAAKNPYLAQIFDGIGQRLQDFVHCRIGDAGERGTSS